MAAHIFNLSTQATAAGDCKSKHNLVCILTGQPGLHSETGSKGKERANLQLKEGRKHLLILFPL